MDSHRYSNGSCNPTSGSDPSRPVMLLPHMQQNPVFISAPTLAQQSCRGPCMYPLPPPPPPPPASSASQAPLTTMPVIAQSNAHIYSQQGGQSHHRSSYQLPSPSTVQTFLPPSTVLPPPPPLPPPPTSQGQILYGPSGSIPSFQLSVPLRNLEPPGVRMPPPPPPSSSLLVPDLVTEKGEAEKHVREATSFRGQALDQEGKGSSRTGPAVGDGESAKGSSVCYGSLLPPAKAEPGSPLRADSDTEMEDDITHPDDDLGLNNSSQAPNCGSHPSGVVCTKELTSHQAPAETNSTIGPSRNFQTGLHGYNTLNPYVQLCQERDDDGSRQASSSPYSGRANNVPESGGGDMYDPFLDSIEPLPSSSNTSTCVQRHELASDTNIVPKLNISSNRPPDIEENNKGNDIQVLSGSDTLTRFSLSSNKPHDVEENIRGNDIGAVIPGSSGDNAEFGENVSGEAGGVSLEIDSPDSPDEAALSNTKAGEDEDAGQRSLEKTRDKEERSMRLFKVVLTQFVKDLLKPSWRQGNMSKEAFKTIVKKTVDKVSRSMEGRRIPKSRAKIDRYIDSSQHKLTKLVMGYVNKYVKA